MITCVDFSLAPERGAFDISLLNDGKSIRKPEAENVCLRQYVGPHKPLFLCGCLPVFEWSFWKPETSCLLKEKKIKTEGNKKREGKETD